MSSDNRMSLSMKMRAETMKISQRSRSLDTFPSINDNGPSSSSTTTTASLSLIKSPKMFKNNMKDNMLRTPNQYERLSGSIDVISSSNVFPDRTTIVHPVAVCVRCSGNASVCMSCTELLCQESLTFYRKTRAIGAASLFQRAVTEAGLTKLMKFSIFKLWYNYIKKTNILRLHRIKVSDQLFFIKGTATITTTSSS
jgi:hypothetical protein